MLNVTCPDTLAPYSSLATRRAGAVAEEAERNKRSKYFHLEASHHLTPVDVESLGALGPDAQSLPPGLGV